MTSASAVRKSEFARLRGVSPGRVSQLIGKGMPVRPDGLIDIAEGDAWCAANLDHARVRGWQGDEASTPADRPRTSAGAAVSLADTRRQKEEVRLERERHELRKAKGEVVERGEVRRFLFTRARMERDRHASWIASIAAQLSTRFGVDPTMLHAELARMMRDHLDDLATLELPEELDAVA